jgi:hypothetical protein
MMEHLQREAEAIREVLPSWNDEKVAQAELQAMSDFLASPDNPYRFTPEEVSGVTDHRLILMALDAQKWRESKKQGSAVTKKIKQLPKFAKTTKAPSKSVKKRAAIEQKKIRLKNTGSTQDAAAVIADLI